MERPIPDKKVALKKVAVVMDDHQLFAESFSTLLKKFVSFSEVYSVQNDKEIFNLLRSSQNRQFYIFLDYYMDNVNTQYLVSDIRIMTPSAYIIMVSSLANPLLIRALLGNHVNAFVSKVSGTSEIIEAIRTVEAKKQYVSPSVQEILDNTEDQNVKFTTKELEIIDLIVQGLSIEGIAQTLHISPNTVITHRRNMMAKAQSHSVTELIAYCYKIGLIFYKS